MDLPADPGTLETHAGRGLRSHQSRERPISSLTGRTVVEPGLFVPSRTTTVSTSVVPSAARDRRRLHRSLPSTTRSRRWVPPEIPARSRIGRCSHHSRPSVARTAPRPRYVELVPARAGSVPAPSVSVRRARACTHSPTLESPRRGSRWWSMARSTRTPLEPVSAFAISVALAPRVEADTERRVAHPDELASGGGARSIEKSCARFRRDFAARVGRRDLFSSRHATLGSFSRFPSNGPKHAPGTDRLGGTSS